MTGSRALPGILAVAVSIAACTEAPRVEPARASEGAGLEPGAAVSGAQPGGSGAREASIVFVTERDGTPRAMVVALDGSGERALLSDERASYPAAVSPDGSRVAVIVVEETEDAGREVHLEQLLDVPLDGGGVRPLGQVAGRARNPDWLPDGRAVIFESDISSYRDIHRADQAASVARLTADDEGNFEPAVSPDGRWIAFGSSRDGNAEIYRMDVDGASQTRLTAFHLDDTAPRWSPDGSAIAFLTDREGVSRIYLMEPDGTRQRRLTAGGRSRSAHESEHAWSPDGTRIAYVERDSLGAPRLMVAAVATGVTLEIAPGATMPAWSPDGRSIAFVSAESGEPQIYLSREDGSARVRVTTGPGPNWFPQWVPARAPAPVHVEAGASAGQSPR